MTTKNREEREARQERREGQQAKQEIAGVMPPAGDDLSSLREICMALVTVLYQELSTGSDLDKALQGQGLELSVLMAYEGLGGIPG